MKDYNNVHLIKKARAEDTPVPIFNKKREGKKDKQSSVKIEKRQHETESLGSSLSEILGSSLKRQQCV